MRYLSFYVVLLGLFLSACQDRATGSQDISKVPFLGSTEQLSIIQTVPRERIARSSYINVEFSSILDAESTQQQVYLLDLNESEEIAVDVSTEGAYLYVKPTESLESGKHYRLVVENGVRDILGNPLNGKYTSDFVCVTDFWSDVRAGYTHAMALSRDGELYVWGNRFYASGGEELKIEQKIFSVPLGLSIGKNPLDFSLGDSLTAIISHDNKLLLDGKLQLAPSQKSSVLAVQASVSQNHVVILQEDGTLWSMGSNEYGQLGNTGFLNRVEFVQESSHDDNWSAVSAGEDFTIALKKDHTLWGWGKNADGQIGSSFLNERRHPVQEDTNASDWKIVSAGGKHACAIKTDATLWCWGSNTYGQLGSGDNNTTRTIRQESTHSTEWVDVSSGYDHTLALKANGTLWAWGSNYYGQLGDDTVLNANVPKQIGTKSNWKKVAAGKNFSLAVDEEGRLWSWGKNNLNQLGLGEDTQDKLTPTEVK